MKIWMRAALVAGCLAFTFGFEAEAQGQGGLLDKLATTSSSGSSGSRVLERATDLQEYQDAWNALCGDGNQKAGKRSRPSSADSLPSPVGTWTYDPDRVLCLRVRQLMYTSVFFPPGERVMEAFLGDDRTFEVKREEKTGRQVLLRPIGDVVGVDTQVTIITEAKVSARRKIGTAAAKEERVYTFYVRSYPVESKAIPNVTVFVKPARKSAGVFSRRPRAAAPVGSVEVAALSPVDVETSAGTESGAQKDTATRANPHVKPDYLREVPFNMNELRFGEFEIAAKSGSEGIAPKRVFHDGRFTVLDFGQGVDGDNTPIVDVAEVIDGIDSTVNVQVGGPTGNFIVIESVGDFRLRNGQRVVCINYTGPEG